MRGEDGMDAHPEKSLVRFTPTCVGKTSLYRNQMLGTSVHPHMRGEDDYSATKAGDVYGSPPHAWGRPIAPPLPSAFYRFTPTCVGKTKCCYVWFQWVTVHPHMRGEDVNHCFKMSGWAGSPPHAWGRQLG